MISSRWKDQQLDHAVDMASVHLKRSALGWDYHRLLRSTEYDTKKSRFLDWKKLVLLFFHVENHQLQHLTGSLCVDSSRFLMRCGPLRPVQLWGKKWLKMISEFDVLWCDEFLCPPVAIGLVSREKARTSSQHPWISLQNQFVEIKSLEISIFFHQFPRNSQHFLPLALRIFRRIFRRFLSGRESQPAMKRPAAASAGPLVKKAKRVGNSLGSVENHGKLDDRRPKENEPQVISSMQIRKSFACSTWLALSWRRWALVMWPAKTNTSFGKQN